VCGIGTHRGNPDVIEGAAFKFAAGLPLHKRQGSGHPVTVENHHGIGCRRVGEEVGVRDVQMRAIGTHRWKHSRVYETIEA
jgi:hypothetical protein